MPRDEDGEVVRWEDTWPYRLQKRLRTKGLDVEVINCASRARTADTLVGADFTEHVVYKRPDLTVLQVGVVDCAPRLFSRNEQRLLRRLPGRLRAAVISHRSAKRRELIRKAPMRRVYTAPDAFRRHVASFASQARESSMLVVVPILADFERMDEKSPGFSENVHRYNRFLEEAARASGGQWVDSTLSAKHFCRDGYHPNVLGHRLLADAIATSVMTAIGRYS
jgi:lysophospholipase L1-like esterase